MSEARARFTNLCQHRSARAIGAVLALALLVEVPEAALAESFSGQLACGTPTVRVKDEGEAERHLPAQTIALLRHPSGTYHAQAEVLAAEFVAVLRQRNPGKQAQIDRAEQEMIVPIALAQATGCGLVEVLAYAERYRNAFTLDELGAIAAEYEKSERMKRPAQLGAAEAAKLHALDGQVAASLQPWPGRVRTVLWAELPPRLTSYGLLWQ